MALIECPECKGALSTTARACPHCGYAVPAAVPPRICEECKGEVEPNRSNCQRCGFVLTGAAPPPAEEPPAREIRVKCPACRALGMVDETTTQTECGSCGKIYDTRQGVELTKARKRLRQRLPPGEAARRHDDYDDNLSLVFGIVGLITCVILSFLAIKYGRPGSAGRTLGYVGIVFWILGIVALCGLYGLAALAHGGAR